MIARRYLLLMSGLALVPASWVAGGWAAITVDELPDYAVAGKPIDLAFAIRQHGMTLIGGLKPSIEARSGSRTVRVHALPRSEGRYAARVDLPIAGEWSITIHSGFGPARVTLLPLQVLAADSRSQPVVVERDRGRRLFVAKGCVTCHVHRDANAKATVEAGPDLTERRFPADYLAKYLADPSIVPPRTSAGQMPNLELRKREIAALVAFINADRRVSAR